MKVNEMRVGNFYHWESEGKKYEYQIEPKDFCSDNYKNFEPIPITEDWLIKLGFEILYQNKSRKVYDYPFDIRFGYSDNFGLKNIDSSVYFVGNSFSHIKYVHQLQNLYFSLTGKELQLIN